MIDHCMDDFILIANNELKAVVSMAAEVLNQKRIYDPKKLFGLMTPNLSWQELLLLRDLFFIWIM